MRDTESTCLQTMDERSEADLAVLVSRVMKVMGRDRVCGRRMRGKMSEDEILYKT